MTFKSQKVTTFFKNNWQLLLILLLAIILRFYKFGQVPAGFTWDEAAIGYNGHAVIKTRRDEWLTFLPISFRSFGDFKAPFAIYLNGLFTLVFGLNKYAVRLPFALAGVLGVLGFFKLTKAYLEAVKYQGKFSSKQLGLVAALIVATSPWHLHFTRAGFETAMALTMICWSFYFLIKFLKLKKKTTFNNKLINLSLSSTLAIASLYTYHSPKIFLPIILLTVLIINRKLFWREKVASLITAVWSLFLLFPFIKDVLFGNGLERGGTLIFFEGLPWQDTVKLFLYNLGSHFMPGFLVGGKTTSLRHGTGVYGVLLPITFSLVVFSLLMVVVSVLTKKQNKKFTNSILLGLGVILAGFLPASLAKGVPQANRAILALPGLILVAVLGFDQFLSLFKQLEAKLKIKQKTVIIVISLIYLFNVGAYLFDYYKHFAKASAEDFQEGYLEVFTYVEQYEKGLNGFSQKDEIIFSDNYGQPYIYALFVRKTNPIWYHGGSLIKYKFVSEVNVADLERQNSVVVATYSQLEEYQDQADKIIYGSDGSVRFRIFVTD
ncbi:MAG: glycosyltransferase family 39 protein [Patescibacteria group bacterium]|nr:glycosyltransferase family 39 protein [Patescibacteria group bacterium]